MGLMDSVGSLGEKAHRKLSSSMVVKNDTEFSGSWDLQQGGDCFIQKIKGRVSPFHEPIITIKKLYISTILSVEIQSSSRDAGGITKAALGGAVLAGPVGAIAGGLFAASKNTHYVRINLKNGININAYLSQETYDQLIHSIDTSEVEEVNSEIKVVEVGGDLIKERVFLVGFVLVLLLVLTMGGNLR